MKGEPPPFTARSMGAFWNYYREKLTPCPCGGLLAFAGANFRSTCWVYCMGAEGVKRCPYGHGFERNHPIAYFDYAEEAAPEAVRVWNHYMAERGWEQPGRSFDARKERNDGA